MTKKFRDENTEIEVDETESKEIKLPPYPTPVREWKDEIRYPHEPLDMRKRILHKVYTLWSLYGALVTSEKLNNLLENGDKLEPSSPEYEIRCMFVDVVDSIAKALSDTNLLEELAWLSCDDPDKMLENLKKQKELEQSKTDAE